MFLAGLGLGMPLLIMALFFSLIFGAVDWSLGLGLGVLVLLGMARILFRLLGVSGWASLGWCLVMAVVGMFVGIALFGWAMSDINFDYPHRQAILG